MVPFSFLFILSHYICGIIVENQDVYRHTTKGRHQLKKTFSFGHCPNHLNHPPLTPIQATWSFFSDAKILRLTKKKVCKNVGRGGRYVNNLKNSLKSNTLAFLKK